VAQGGVFSVRGIPGVSVYVDGVVRSGDLGILFDMVELERVEALRGPQGTLFGRNAIGGAIQYVTKAPSDQYGARVQATVGNFNRLDLTGNIDLPLTDTLLSKITVAKTKRDGFVESTTIDRAYGSEDNTNVRLQLLWKPSQSFSARLTGENINDESNHQPRVLIGLTPNSNVPLYALIGDPITSAEIYGARKEYKTSMDWDRPGYGTTSYNGALTLDWSLSDTWALKSLTGTRSTKQYNFNDSDATRHDLFQHWFIYDRNELSQELQAQYSSDRLSGVVGLYYFQDEQWQHLIRWSGNELQRGANLALLQSLGARCGPPPRRPWVPATLMRAT
jgi:iron complex outermembrane receptor protein